MKWVAAILLCLSALPAIAHKLAHDPQDTHTHNGPRWPQGEPIITYRSEVKKENSEEFAPMIEIDPTFKNVANGYWTAGWNRHLNGCIVGTKYRTRKKGRYQHMFIGKALVGRKDYTYLAFTSPDKSFHNAATGHYSMVFNFLLSRRKDVDYYPTNYFYGTNPNSPNHGYYILVDDNKLLELVAEANKLAVFWKDPSTNKSRIIVGPISLRKSRKAISELTNCMMGLYAEAQKIDEERMARSSTTTSNDTFDNATTTDTFDNTTTTDTFDNTTTTDTFDNTTTTDTFDNTETPTEDTNKKYGSGFFISKAGHILTNNHVVENCGHLQVKASDGKQYDARTIKSDRSNDLALLVSTAKSETIAEFEYSASLGERVFVFGYPLAGFLSSSGTFTDGSVSSLEGIGDDSRMLQMSAPVQPGNSGGALLNEKGAVIGIVTSKADAISIASVTQDIAQNVNFALKSSIALSFIQGTDVKPKLTVASEERKASEIAALGKSMSVKIICEPSKNVRGGVTAFRIEKGHAFMQTGYDMKWNTTLDECRTSCSSDSKCKAFQFTEAAWTTCSLYGNAAADTVSSTGAFIGRK